MIKFSENVVLGLGFMLALVAIRKSSRRRKVAGVAVFELCDVWTGVAGPSSSLLLGAESDACMAEQALVLIDTTS